MKDPELSCWSCSRLIHTQQLLRRSNSYHRCLGLWGERPGIGGWVGMRILPIFLQHSELVHLEILVAGRHFQFCRCLEWTSFYCLNIKRTTSNLFKISVEPGINRALKLFVHGRLAFKEILAVGPEVILSFFFLLNWDFKGKELFIPGPSVGTISADLDWQICRHLFWQRNREKQGDQAYLQHQSYKQIN